MDAIEAKILIRNLFKRMVVHDGGGYVFEGKLTDDEYAALGFALGMLESGGAIPPAPIEPPTPVPTQPDSQLPPLPDPGTEPAPEPAPEPEPTPVNWSSRLDIDWSALELPDAPDNIRLCLDFGTAMSKATLVVDGEDEWDDEAITVLHLGEYGDDVDDYKLISAVYIDDEGKLWFGKEAEENCDADSPNGERQVMDNIKHWLSLGQVDSEVDGKFNPTSIPVTYAEVILAYLTFQTWAVNKALENLEQPPGGYPRNINRRFAMPCLSGSEFKEASYRMRRYLGEAQVLADTFFSDIRNGLPLERFVAAVNMIREGSRRDYRFVKEGITEPLGVAGTLLNYASEESHHIVVMVMDIGAGTSDFSVYQMRIEPERDIRVAVEAAGSVSGVTEAGNHLDSTLMGLVYAKLGLDWESIPARVQWALNRNIREYKEELFDQGVVVVSLPGGYETKITLDEFRNTPGVQDFTKSLDHKMKEILETISPDWIDLIGTKVPYLTVALTGGGASLPMVQELAKREIMVRNRPIRVVPATPFPKWLEEAHHKLELDYPRIAVSLGGARKKLVQSGGTARATAGGADGRLVYDDPKYQW